MNSKASINFKKLLLERLPGWCRGQPIYVNNSLDNFAWYFPPKSRFVLSKVFRTCISYASMPCCASLLCRVMIKLENAGTVCNLIQKLRVTWTWSASGCIWMSSSVYEGFFSYRTRNDCFILFWAFGTFCLFSVLCSSSNSELSFWERSVHHKINLLYGTSLSPMLTVTFFLHVNNTFSVNAIICWLNCTV